MEALSPLPSCAEPALCSMKLFSVVDLDPCPASLLFEPQRTVPGDQWSILSWLVEWLRSSSLERQDMLAVRFCRPELHSARATDSLHLTKLWGARNLSKNAIASCRDAPEAARIAVEPVIPASDDSQNDVCAAEPTCIISSRKSPMHRNVGWLQLEGPNNSGIFGTAG